MWVGSIHFGPADLAAAATPWPAASAAAVAASAALSPGQENHASAVLQQTSYKHVRIVFNIGQ